jgi:hypothetical protein
MPATKKPAKRPAKKAAKDPAAKRSATKKASARSERARPDGDARVLAYIAQLPPEQRAIAQRIDEIVTKQVPDVRRAVKWNVPFYGLDGRGWFCAFAAFTRHSSLNFFLGAKLKPAPPDGGVKENRRVAYRTLADIDEQRLASWIRQAAALPGWLSPR